MTMSQSYWPADTSESVLELTVGDVLHQAARDAPNVHALLEIGADGAALRTWTYAELLREAQIVASALLARFRPGEHVAVWAPNMPEWVLLEYGCALAGLVLVTVNPAYRPVELSYVLEQSDSVGVFYTPEFRGSPMRQFLEQSLPKLPKIRDAISLTDWDAFLATADGADGRLPTVWAADPVQIQYTSGTTGKPKGAVLLHRGVTNNVRFAASRARVTGGEVFLNFMPLFHTAGCVFAVLSQAVTCSTLVLLPMFDPALVLDSVEAHRATALFAVPTMLIALLDELRRKPRDLSSLHRVISAGSTVPAPLVRRVCDGMGVGFTILFGQTETSPIITQTRPTDPPEVIAGTLGLPLPQTEVKIVDPVSGEICPTGVPGELCTRGYLLMRGYYRLPPEAQAIDASGWLHTGDLCSMDERGYCRIQGRLKDMIIRGGENIYPREIEELLFTYPKVADVAVVGIPDERWGEVVAAFVRPAGDETPTADELRAFCREHLAPQKTPFIWIFVDDFPLTPSGKVQKFVLRDRFLKERDNVALKTQ